MNGFCKRGENCIFAHGENELKALPKYKKCMYGRKYCKFGAACRFIHEDENELHFTKAKSIVNEPNVHEIYSPITKPKVNSQENSFDNILKPESDEIISNEDKDSNLSDKTYSSFGDFLSVYSMT